MKFLHAADIHLDSPLAGLSRRADLPAEIIRDCTRRAFRALIDLAIAEDVAFVIIAGDLYDGDWRDFSTGLFFAAEMQRLARPCFLLRGNHDAQSVISRSLKRPPNVREFSSRRCETFDLPELGVALHGHSFPNRAVPEDLSAGYPAAIPGRVNIGVLHTSATGSGEHETYSPCTVAALALKGYDYWALGHIHARQVLSRQPWIVFPGNIQGRHAKETGAKGATLVTVEEGRLARVEHRALDVLRWAAIDIDAHDADVLSLTRRIEAGVEGALADADGLPMLARLTVSGSSGSAARLVEDADELAAITRNHALEQGGKLWIESVRTRASGIAAWDDSAPLLLRQAFDAALDDPTLVETLLAAFEALMARVPAPARAGLEVPADQAALQQLREEAWQVAAKALAEARNE